MSKSYFICEETPYYPGKYIVRPVHCNLPLTYTEGSYNLLAARLMNLGYADYLRMCRDLYGAEVIGKNTMYPNVFLHLYNEPTETLPRILKISSCKKPVLYN